MRERGPKQRCDSLRRQLESVTHHGLLWSSLVLFFFRGIRASWSSSIQPPRHEGLARDFGLAALSPQQRLFVRAKERAVETRANEAEVKAKTVERVLQR